MVISLRIQKKEPGNKVSNTQLTIHISRTSVHVAEVLRSNQEIVRSSNLELHESTPAQYRSALKDFFNTNGFDKEYDEVSAAWSTAQNALIPLRVYNDTDPKSLYKLLFGNKIDQKTIDFNRLMELSIVSVFEIPDWVKSFFVINYPHITIKHEQALVLRAVFQASTFHKSIHISLCDDYMNIFLVHHNELKFSNAFEYQTVDDILYYSMYVLEQEGWKDQSAKLHGYFVGDQKRQLLEEFEKKMKRLKSAENISIQPFTNSLTLQPLCV